MPLVLLLHKCCCPLVMQSVWLRVWPLAKADRSPTTCVVSATPYELKNLQLSIKSWTLGFGRRVGVRNFPQETNATFGRISTEIYSLFQTPSVHKGCKV
ncbi:hypothetical protein KC19_6G219800 [Ceratodon purpureus]|uniref:Secreted protein n=1 Tax=Ceratodon purpureus TaxID=3225 RepID=A0A8T0HK87_CERPU|nr:hypothetical protein KC19_6G219800 [Ceratodon purpureus]